MNMAVSWAIGRGWAMPGKASWKKFYPKRYLEDAREEFALGTEQQEERGCGTDQHDEPSGCQRVIPEGDMLGRMQREVGIGEVGGSKSLTPCC